MGRKGSRKNERKANRKRTEKAAEKIASLRKQIADLKSLPIRSRSSEFVGELDRLAGMLRRAQNNLRKSETHSVTGKGGKR